jgi:hypothetical protein
MELLKLGWRGFTDESIKNLAEKFEDKKFVKKLQKFYSNQ